MSDIQIKPGFWQKQVSLQSVIALLVFVFSLGGIYTNFTNSHKDTQMLKEAIKTMDEAHDAKIEELKRQFWERFSGLKTYVEDEIEERLDAEEELSAYEKGYRDGQVGKNKAP